jgi:hypothetical protein
MHYPDTEEMKTELRHRAAVFHARAIIDYINSFSCSTNEKIQLINRIQELYSKDE